MAGETTEMGAHCPKHGFVGVGQPQSGPYPGTCRQANHERVGNRTHVPKTIARDRQNEESVPILLRSGTLDGNAVVAATR